MQSQKATSTLAPSNSSRLAFNFLTMPCSERVSSFALPIGEARQYAFGGIFIDPSPPSSLVDLISCKTLSSGFTEYPSQKCNVFNGFKRCQPRGRLCCFMNVSIRWDGVERGANSCAIREDDNGSNSKKNARAHTTDVTVNNTSKHFWAGAVAAMVSRTCLAPLERLKLEYIVRGEQKAILELVNNIATTQGLQGFWRGNLINILRTAPFKAVNFCAYDTFRKQLLRISGNEETTNVERFIAGAAAGMSATILCLPLDTIRTKMVAPGGEALGGVFGVFRYMVRTEGFFSLYKGLVPSIMSMAPSGAVFYGVYDLLKTAYLRSSEGRKRINIMNKNAQNINALNQLELGTMRTLLYGAIAGACAETVTYPFEVVRRQLQLQVRATKLNAFATFIKIVETGGFPALYAGLIPSLLQVLPSAAISFFVYEFMKVVLKAD